MNSIQSIIDEIISIIKRKQMIEKCSTFNSICRLIFFFLSFFFFFTNWPVKLAKIVMSVHVARLSVYCCQKVLLRLIAHRECSEVVVRTGIRRPQPVIK